MKASIIEAFTLREAHVPDTAKITILKTMNYRGLAEEFSNTYHFSGTTPSTSAAWKTLFDAIVANERPTQTTFVGWVGGYGYEPGSATADWTYDYAANGVALPLGSLAAGTMVRAPGDAAAQIRWSTGAFGSTGKPIYLRKYIHPAWFTSGAPDVLEATFKTALTTYGATWTSGTLPGSVKICRPQGGDGVTVFVPNFITTRTLKRRGKRPTAA